MTSQPPDLAFTADRVLVVVDEAFRPADDAHRRTLEAVAGRDAHVVTPARSVPGERWVVDLTARRAAAEQRLRTWAAALGEHARSVQVEVGDESLRAAAADAAAALPADRVVLLAPSPRPTRRPRAGRRLATRRPAVFAPGAPSVRPGVS